MKRPAKKEKWKSCWSGAVPRKLRELSDYLQRATQSFSRRQWLLLLTATVVAGTGLSTVLMVEGLRNPQDQGWKPAPIKPFPLPPLNKQKGVEDTGRPSGKSLKEVPITDTSETKNK